VGGICDSNHRRDLWRGSLFPIRKKIISQKSFPSLNFISGFLTGIALFIFSSFLLAQSYLVHNYYSRDGLLSPEVHDLLQDQEGRLWIATRGGISVYDGFTWESFTMTNGLPGNYVVALDQDEQGRIWALIEVPELALVYYAHEKWARVPLNLRIEEKTSFNHLKVINQEKKGLLIALGTKNDGLFIVEGGKSYHYDSFPQGKKRVTGLATYQGNLLVATESGLFVLVNGQLDDTLVKKFPFFAQGIRGLALEEGEKGQRLWLAGSDWLGILEGNEFKILKQSLSFHVEEGFPYLILCPDKKGGVYFGNPLQLFHWRARSDQISSLGRKSGLIANGATALYLDREKNIWIGTLRGLSKLVSERFANYNENQGLLENEVTSIQELKPGWLIFGHPRGLTHFRDNQVTTVSFGRGLRSETRVLDLFKDSNGKIWVAASDLGLGVIDQTGKLKWLSPNKGLKGRVFSVVEDGQKKIWVATSQGLFTYQSGFFREVASTQFKNLYLRKLFLRPSGEPVLVTSSSGYFRLEGERWLHYECLDNELANDIFAYVENEEGRVWVGTLGGLFQVQEGKFYPVNFNGQKISHPVYLIMPDREGGYWIGTNKGIYHWDKQHLRHFDQSLGLAGDEINRSAGFIDSQGNLWIGTNNGVSCYQPEEDISEGELPFPLVELREVKVGTKSHPPFQPLSLKFNENDLIFGFRIISFVDEKKIKYRTRLLGFESEWSEVRPLRELEEEYTNLPPGKYQFQIQAQNVWGRWSEVISSAPIVIHRAFWTTWWFIVLLALLGMGVYFVIFQAVTSRRYAQKLKVLVEARTKELARSLQEKEALLQEIHHRVKNNLQVISSLLYLQAKKIKDEQDRAIFEESRHRIQAMALTHEILYSSDRLDQVSAANYLQRIIDALFRSYLGKSTRIKGEVKIDKNLYISLDEALPCGLIVNELVSNALKHAFPGQREGKIKVWCTCETAPDSQGEKQGVLVVEDDGVGVPPDFELNNNLGLGLKMVYNLVRQLEGEIEIKRERGTAFIIRFPLGRKKS